MPLLLYPRQLRPSVRTATTAKILYFYIFNQPLQSAGIPGGTAMNSVPCPLVVFLNNSMFLFKVDERFMVTGRGLILVPGLGDKKVIVGDPIKIVRPDQTTVYTNIRGIGWNEFRDILVGSELAKDDVPIGSEVWLNKEQ